MTTSNNPNTGFESAPKALNVDDFPQSEKLKKEKELLGFYVSDHPLKAVRQSAQILDPINLSQLSEQRQKASISAVVMLSNVKQVTTKNGDRMAILQLEDLTGQTEAVVFHKTYERLNSLLVVDARLIVWGKVDRRDEQTQLIVEDAEPIEKVQMVMLELTPQQAVEQQERLKSILQEQVGDKEKAKVPVVAIITSLDRQVPGEAANSSHMRQLVRFGRQFWVQDSKTAVEVLKTAKFPAHVQPLVSQF